MCRNNDSKGAVGLKEIESLSIQSLFAALMRENFVLKAQLGALRDTLIDEGLIDEEASDDRVKSILNTIDEDEYNRYIIEIARVYEGISEKSSTN